MQTRQTCQTHKICQCNPVDLILFGIYKYIGSSWVQPGCVVIPSGQTIDVTIIDYQIQTCQTCQTHKTI